MSKLLSFGGFGCVFYPAFNCSGRILSDKYVSKIQRSTMWFKLLFNYVSWFIIDIFPCTSRA